MELHIGICDDILLQRSILIEFVKTYLDKRGILFKIYEFSSGEDLVSNYPEKLDILFLDILMNDMTGMDASRKIRNLIVKWKYCLLPLLIVMFMKGMR